MALALGSRPVPVPWCRDVTTLAGGLGETLDALSSSRLRPPGLSRAGLWPASGPAACPWLLAHLSGGVRGLGPADPFLSREEFCSLEVSPFLLEGGTRLVCDPGTQRGLCCGCSISHRTSQVWSEVSGSPPQLPRPPGAGPMAQALALLTVPEGQLPLSLRWLTQPPPQLQGRAW